MEIFGMKYF